MIDIMTKLQIANCSTWVEMFTHAGSLFKKVILNNLVILSSNSKLLRGRIFPIEADKYENFYLRTKIRHGDQIWWIKSQARLKCRLKAPDWKAGHSKQDTSTSQNNGDWLKKVWLIELAVIYPSFYFLDSGIGCLTTVCSRIIFLHLPSKDPK